MSTVGQNRQPVRYQASIEALWYERSKGLITRGPLAYAGFAGLACLLAVPALSGQTKSGAKAAAARDAVVATVNGQKIMRLDIANEVLDDQAARLRATNPQFQDRARPIAGSIGALVMKRMASSGNKPVSITRSDIIEWLFTEKPPVLKDAVQNRIREVAIIQYARARGVTVSNASIEKQVAAAINNARTQLRLQGKSDAMVLKELGYRPGTIRRGVITSLYLEGVMKKELEAKIGHPLGADDYREGRHILIRVNAQPPIPEAGGDTPPSAPDTEAAFAEAKKKIDAIAQEIANKVKTFEQAAKDSSDDTSKFQEGSLGVFIRGQMVPEFEAVAFELPVGVVSQPVRSAFGWHLIRIDKLGKDIPAAEREKTWQSYMRSHVQGKVTEIMNAAKVVNKVGPPEQPSFPAMR